jgi:hypothetical protein
VIEHASSPKAARGGILSPDSGLSKRDLGSVFRKGAHQVLRGEVIAAKPIFRTVERRWLYSSSGLKAVVPAAVVTVLQ